MPLIRTPIVFSPQEFVLISSANHADDWELSKFKHIIKKIRVYYKAQQKMLCPYCNIEIDEAGNFVSVDHITPKKQHFQFMFAPKNLAVVCVKCNTYKSSKKTLPNFSNNTYPSSSRKFLIIHPHFDEYKDHIKLIDDQFYRGKTPKGFKTISICKLDRPELAEKRAKLKKIKNQGIWKQLALKLTDATGLERTKLENKIRRLV